MHGGKYPFNILFAYLSLMAVFTISLLALKYLDGKEKSTELLIGSPLAMFHDFTNQIPISTLSVFFS